jgi:hypothetical protein
MNSKKLFPAVLVALVVLTPSLPVMAQNNTRTNTTIEGCLDGAIDNYTLTDPAGTTYKLTGDVEQLKTRVGGTIRVTGVVTPVKHVPGAMSEGTETEPSLSVISLKQVSDVCIEANNIS